MRGPGRGINLRISMASGALIATLAAAAVMSRAPGTPGGSFAKQRARHGQVVRNPRVNELRPRQPQGHIRPDTQQRHRHKRLGKHTRPHMHTLECSLIDQGLLFATYSCTKNVIYFKNLPVKPC